MKKYDCIIAGGGAAGFAAAIGAAQAGAKVLLLDRMPCVGGTAVYAVTPILSGWPKAVLGNAVGGMLGEELKKLNAYEWRVNKIVTNEDSLQSAMMNILQRHNVDLLFNAELCEVKVVDSRIESVTVLCGGSKVQLAADNFVDATGDGSFSILAGAETVEPSDEESMTKTLMFKVRHVKNFNRELVIETFAQNVQHFPIKIQDSFMGMPLTDPEEVVLNLTAVPGNAADPIKFSAMYKELFDQIEPIMEFMRKYIPGFADAVVSKVAPQVGVRYCRSVVCRKRLTVEDMFNPVMTDEPVAFCGSFIGGHFIKQFESPWGAKVTGKPAVPYGALQVKGVDNLLVAGKIIDIEARAISAVRLVAGCMATGQAAGIAAALNIPEYSVLRAELEKQNCMFWLDQQ